MEMYTACNTKHWKIKLLFFSPSSFFCCMEDVKLAPKCLHTMNYDRKMSYHDFDKKGAFLPHSQERKKEDRKKGPREQKNILRSSHIENSLVFPKTAFI